MTHPSARASAYGARPIRARATAAEMRARREAVVRIVADSAPTSVRHAFYSAVTIGLVSKDDRGYKQVQREILAARRDGDIPYEAIVDSTRWARLAQTYDGVADAIAETAALYRRDLWRRSPYRLEVWAESDSIAGVIQPVTERWAVPLMVTRGYASESFAWSAAQAWRADTRTPVVLYVGDHDPAGLEIEHTLRRQLEAFYGGESVTWNRVGVTWTQVIALDLVGMGTPPKRRGHRHDYPYPVAVEAEALPAPVLRAELEECITDYVDADQLKLLIVAERDEREILARILSAANNGDFEDER